MSNAARSRWFATVLGAALEGKLIDPVHVMAYVTPEVMATSLPPDIMSKILSSSLSSGAMTPNRLLEILTPEVLSDNVPLEVLWGCIVAAAERAGITGVEPSA